MRIAGFGIALVVFAGGLALAWMKSDVDDVAWLPIIVVALAVPLSVSTSAWQLRVVARSVAVDPGWRSVVRVTTLGTLSSVLPISSGSIVRGGAVLYWGARPGPTVRAFLFDSLVWLVVALGVAGGAALALSEALLGWVLLAVAAALTPVALAIAGPTLASRPRLEIAASRLVGVLVEAVRLAASFTALGSAIDLLQAGVLTASSALSGLFFFLPGGLGFLEALTAGFAMLVGLGPGQAFLAAALNRLVGLSVLLAWATLLWVSGADRFGNARP